jgi:hypothetical protein
MADDSSKVEPPDVPELLRKIAALREEVDDLRGSAISWEKLYAAAVQRHAEATQRMVDLAALASAAFLFRVPDRCPQCGARGCVNLEQTEKNRLVLLNWCCRDCGHEWLVTSMERVERRTASADRRKTARKDRRRR